MPTYMSLQELQKDPEMVKLIIDESDAKGLEPCCKALGVSMQTVYGARYIGGKAVPPSIKEQFDKGGVALASQSKKKEEGRVCLVCNSKVEFARMAEHFKKYHPQYIFTSKRRGTRGGSRYVCACGTELNDFKSLIKHYDAKHQGTEPDSRTEPRVITEFVPSNLPYGIRQFAEDLQKLLKDIDSLREGNEKLEIEYANLRRVINEQQVAVAEQLARLK